MARAEQRASRRGLLAVAVAAALARLAHWALVTPGWRPRSDADQYILLARSLVDGNGFSLVYPQLELHATAFRPPLYPALLAPAAAVTDGLWAARLTNVVLGVVVVVLAAVLAGRVAGPSAAVAAGMVTALYPPLLVNDTVTLSEPLALALLLGLVLLVDDRRWEWAAAATAALLLTRPNAYLVVVVLAVLAVRHAGWRTCARAMAVVVALVAPWSLRNAVQVGTPRLVTSDAFTLAAVFAPHAQAAQQFVDPVLDRRYDGDTALRLSQFDESVWVEALMDRAQIGITRNPDYVLENAGDNVLLLFELSPGRNEDAEELDGRNLDFRRATLPLFYVVTVLGVAGLWRRRRDARVQVLAVLGVQFALVAIAILAPPRLRTPFDLACAIGLGLLIADLPFRRSGRPDVTAEAAAGDDLEPLPSG